MSWGRMQQKVGPRASLGPLASLGRPVPGSHTEPWSQVLLRCQGAGLAAQQVQKLWHRPLRKERALSACLASEETGGWARICDLTQGPGGTHGVSALGLPGQQPPHSLEASGFRFWSVPAFGSVGGAVKGSQVSLVSFGSGSC